MRKGQPGENVSQNVQERVESTITFFEDQLNLFRTGIKETRERIGIPGKETKLPKKAKLPGSKGSLVKMPVAILVEAADNTTKFLLKQAEITRKWVKK